ncbi:uncharacterized protein LOC124965389 [Sciurus carolinensis]|uniref:uncharacterized protein LOC124965389 n=1 Tax=Sciurus carolinensis TaxID=30640 RepID=UPI001FB4543D|nr:uncharacterized protein LOC124965389 [Sciurus carolinensis]
MANPQEHKHCHFLIPAEKKILSKGFPATKISLDRSGRKKNRDAGPPGLGWKPPHQRAWKTGKHAPKACAGGRAGPDRPHTLSAGCAGRFPSSRRAAARRGPHAWRPRSASRAGPEKAGGRSPPSPAAPGRLQLRAMPSLTTRFTRRQVVLRAERPRPCSPLRDAQPRRRPALLRSDFPKPAPPLACTGVGGPTRSEGLTKLLKASLSC